MKNLHLIPTDKPSRLFKSFGKLNIGDYITERENLQVTNQHTYITSDEEIKGDWCYDEYNKVVFKNTGAGTPGASKKIILTTDQDLIADGVQAIDDEFLEWFVKNPSCESVEVKKKYSDFTVDPFVGYEIIIPTEEPKQETEEDWVNNSPYCPICDGCGEDGCCSAAHCQQHPDGHYCKTYLAELKFGYRMYNQVMELIDDDPKYKEQIDKIRRYVYDFTFRKEEN